MNTIKTLLIGLALLLCLSACQKEEIIAEKVSDLLWLEHKDAQMPILVEGNTLSKTFLLFLHGGPGGSAKTYNETLRRFSEPLEKRYAVAYWDQRLAGNSRGRAKSKDLTVALMKEDLDLVVDLLRHRYGSEIKIFLLGHSWGGYLGNAYLTDPAAQQKISGWIDVSGAHNIRKLTLDGLRLMRSTAEERLNVQSDKTEAWRALKEYTLEVDTTIVDRGLVMEVNKKAGEAIGLAREDDLVDGLGVDFTTFWQFLFTDFNIITQLHNTANTSNSNLLDEIIEAPLSNELEKIKLPTLLIWGKFDFVVPPTLGEEALQKLGTPEEDKRLVIFDRIGHLPMGAASEAFNAALIDFVEQYK